MLLDGWLMAHCQNFDGADATTGRASAQQTAAEIIPM